MEGRLAGSVNLIHDAGLEGAADMMDVGVHCADVVRLKGGGDETTHALMFFLTLDPYERAADDADEDGADNGRVMIIVRVLRVDVGERNVVTYDQLYKWTKRSQSVSTGAVRRCEPLSRYLGVPRRL